MFQYLATLTGVWFAEVWMTTSSATPASPTREKVKNLLWLMALVPPVATQAPPVAQTWTKEPADSSVPSPAIRLRAAAESLYDASSTTRTPTPRAWAASSASV
nr:hypothetical protein [Streptomyces harenosi]